jgi:DNA polymerase IV
MSRETAFERDMYACRDRALLTPALTALCERVAGDPERKGYSGRTVGVKC